MTGTDLASGEIGLRAARSHHPRFLRHQHPDISNEPINSLQRCFGFFLGVADLMVFHVLRFDLV